MFRIICNILLGILMTAALGLAILLGVPMLQGNQLYVVLTASMEPTYPVDSIVVIEPVDGTTIAVDDVITFEAAGFQDVITHRVIEVDKENGQLITKGDNNDSADFYPVPMESVRGRVIRGIPYVGILVTAITTPGGILAMIWIIFIVIMLLVLPNLIEKRKQIKLGEEENDVKQT